MRNEYTIFVEKQAGKRLLRKPRRRWKNNIKTSLREGVGF
jgi:hypothetical protein